MNSELVNPEGHEDPRVVDLLCNRLFVEDDEELIKRLLGALFAVLKATGDVGAAVFEEYCRRL